MKPEALKGKTQSHCHRKNLTDRHDVHDDKDFKSAVEFMKWRFLEEGFDYPNNIINESFHDLFP